MSLTHGHFYVAESVREKLNGDIRYLIDNHLDEYHLGCLGHDILYWTGNYNWDVKNNSDPSSPVFILPVDPHQSQSGMMIQNLLQDVLIRKNTIAANIQEREERVRLRDQELERTYKIVCDQINGVTDEHAKTELISEKERIEKEQIQNTSDKKTITLEKEIWEKLQEVSGEKKNNSGGNNQKLTTEDERKTLEERFNALFLHEIDNPVNGYLAFILGWITHWATDLYIHSLVNLYGGRFSLQPEEMHHTHRHVQLELMETKYLLEKKTDLIHITVPDLPEIWKFFVTPLSKTYPDAVILNSGNRRIRPDEHPDIFSECVSTCGVPVMRSAIRCANECCTSINGQATTTGSRVVEWAYNPARFPQQIQYNQMTAWQKPRPDIPPIITITAVPQSAGPAEFDVTTSDTGLYGKFLKDYEPFIGAAIARAAEILIAAKKEIDTSVLSSVPEELSRFSLGNVDILYPEGSQDIITSEAMKGISDNTVRDIFSLPESKRHQIHYKIEYRFVSEIRKYYDEFLPEKSYTDKGEIAGRSLVIPEQNDRPFPSRAGTVRIPVGTGIPNPEKLYCEGLVSVSVTNGDAFTTKKYKDIEYAELPWTYPGKVHHVFFTTRGGNISMEGDCFEGKRNGKWIIYHDNGRPHFEINFKDNIQHGHSIEYTEEGRVREEGDYTEGKRNGWWAIENQEDEKEEGLLKDDLKQGHWIENHRCEQREEGDYINNKREGLWIVFSNGKKTAEEHYSDGKLSGRYRSYNNEGQIVDEGNFKDGKRSGHWISCYLDTGVKSEEGDYSEDLRNGMWISYMDGYKIFEVTFKDGIRNGPWRKFYPNGQKATEGEYINGRLGHWVEYNIYGEKYSEGEG